MHIHPFRAIYPNLDLIAAPDTFFETVKFEFHQYFKSGFFREDDTEAMFVYQIKTPRRAYYAIIACAEIQDYEEGKLLRHEKTMVAKEQQMMHLLLQRKAMIKPIVVAYKPEQEIGALVSEVLRSTPFLDVRFEEEQQSHLLFRVTDREIQRALRTAFSKGVDKAYIADGHHRCETIAKLYRTVKAEVQPLDFSKLLCAFFSFDHLVIHDYNRIVEILHEISPAVLIARLSRLCTIKVVHKPQKPRYKHEMTMYLEGQWYRLRWRKHVMRRYAHHDVLLDGHILNVEVLQEILGIEDVSEDQRLGYVEGIAGIDGIIEKTQRSAFRIAFCIYPVSMEELVSIADAGQTLPPKSTWFEPRIKTGLVSKGF